MLYRALVGTRVLHSVGEADALLMGRIGWQITYTCTLVQFNLFLSGNLHKMMLFHRYIGYSKTSIYHENLICVKAAYCTCSCSLWEQGQVKQAQLVYREVYKSFAPAIIIIIVIIITVVSHKTAAFLKILNSIRSI